MWANKGTYSYLNKKNQARKGEVSIEEDRTKSEF